MPDDDLVSALRGIVQQNGVKIFREGFAALDYFQNQLRGAGIEITDQQMTAIKRSIVKAIKTPKGVKP